MIRIYLDEKDSKRIDEIKEAIEHESLHNVNFGAISYMFILDSDFTYADDCDEGLGVRIMDVISMVMEEK
jgi:hypothetical protein